MNERAKQRWEKTRRQGQHKFVMVGGMKIGLLVFGILIPASKFIFHFIYSGYNLSFFDWGYQVKLLIDLVLSFPQGCLFSWLIWNLNEWQYRRK
jgi:hypothetical protein